MSPQTGWTVGTRVLRIEAGGAAGQALAGAPSPTQWRLPLRGLLALLTQCVAAASIARAIPTDKRQENVFHDLADDFV
jgi:hypothetical protein